MNGDFTRLTFAREKHYSAVLMQQGRVQVDADWNEQQAIQEYRARTAASDVIGASGVPEGLPDSFSIGSADGAPGDLTIGKGRCYVDGILCENERDCMYSTQPDLPQPPDLLQELRAANTDFGIVYLDVWRRHITALDDPAIREPALGGPDTTTRLKTVWQVRLQPVDARWGSDDAGAGTPWVSLDTWQELTRAPAGTLNARLQPAAGPPTAGLVSPVAGYRGLENQLYRVEIHHGGDQSTATFKWSRDNGSVVTAVEGIDRRDVTVHDIGPDDALGFAPDMWVELADDLTELGAVPSRPLARITGVDAGARVITLDSQFPGVDLTHHPRLRRWDGAGLSSTTDGWVQLENGIEVSFGPGEYRPGDYWLIPARTATGTIEWPSDDAPQPQPPRGIFHHRAPLAVVAAEEDTLTVVEDLRKRFPSLSGLSAANISFDGAEAGLADAETVQDALRRLYGERDLRHHNLNLHGWGIVNGLQVVCDSDDERRGVIVQPGYAIDSHGNDILVERPHAVDVLAAIERLEEERALWNPEGPPVLDQDGNGEVSLTLRLDRQDRRRHYAVEHYDPDSNGSSAALDGTLLQDLYRRYADMFQEFLLRELAPEQDQDTQRMPRLSPRGYPALVNLLAQVVDPEGGQRIFVSADEDATMRQFYTRLREMLRSETYCGLFDRARPFPRYPLPDLGIRSIVSRDHHTRLRLRPGGNEAYTVGAGLNPLQPSGLVNRLDLQAQRLSARIDPVGGAEVTWTGPPAGTGAGQDVAFSPDGSMICVIVSSRDERGTFFRTGKIESDSITWGSITTFSGIKLVTLATTAADPTAIYAIGEHKGIYKIVPEAIDEDMAPWVAFDALGHLAITADGRAYATARTGSGVGCSLVRVKVPENERQQDIDLQQPHCDDIALLTHDAGLPASLPELVCSVVGPDGAGPKELWVHDMGSGQPLQVQPPTPSQQAAAGGAQPASPPAAPNPVALDSTDRTTVRLAALAAKNAVLLTVEDACSIRMVDLGTLTVAPEYALPVQVGATSIATDGRSGVYALNSISDTVTAITDAKLLDPAARFPAADLEAYRSAVLEAFADLLAGLVQYLKDALFDQMLVRAPEDDVDEPLYLACVSIRGYGVARVCNFTRRRYVHTFPTVEYWLSLAPIIPLLQRLIGRLGSADLMDLFGRGAGYPLAGTPWVPLGVPRGERISGGEADLDGRVRSEQVRAIASWLQAENIPALRALFDQKRRSIMDLLRTTLTTPPARHVRTVDPALAASNIVGQPVSAVTEALHERKIDVVTREYEPAEALLSQVVGFFRTPGPGAEVTLYQEAGRVAQYAVSDSPLVRNLRAEVASLSQALAQSQGQMEHLQRQIDQQAGFVRTLSDTLGALIAALSQQEQTPRRPG